MPFSRAFSSINAVRRENLSSTDFDMPASSQPVRVRTTGTPSSAIFRAMRA
jgi:hypothetical protein